MFRISYVGENGWEVYVPTENGLGLWDAVWAAGQAHGIVPVGVGVYGVTGRIEKGYRLMGAELDSEYTPSRPGWPGPRSRPPTSSARRRTWRRGNASRWRRCARWRCSTTRHAGRHRRYMTGGTSRS